MQLFSLHISNDERAIDVADTFLGNIARFALAMQSGRGPSRSRNLGLGATKFRPRPNATQVPSSGLLGGPWAANLPGGDRLSGSLVQDTAKARGAAKHPKYQPFCYYTPQTWCHSPLPVPSPTIRIS